MLFVIKRFIVNNYCDFYLTSWKKHLIFCEKLVCLHWPGCTFCTFMSSWERTLLVWLIVALTSLLNAPWRISDQSGTVRRWPKFCFSVVLRLTCLEVSQAAFASFSTSANFRRLLASASALGPGSSVLHCALSGTRMSVANFLVCKKLKNLIICLEMPANSVYYLKDLQFVKYMYILHFT